MKRFLISFCLLTACFGAYAQKSYVNLSAWVNEESGHYMVLSGEIPIEMKKVYNRGEGILVGDILNMLSSKGFEVEFMSGLGSGQSAYQNINFLLSKKTSSNESNAVRHIAADDGGDVYEVARYNLQGLPIIENEKGVQIVVYSNYTTKTIIVQ